uniref:Uncharacterized protein n=1 Tax=virus sp. ctLl75 TaxID=2828249 RepID=A0A8S5RBB9_9VIRU|nr:MAG TPA: hypothetical protein [virus sp. ctLl75]
MVLLRSLGLLVMISGEVKVYDVPSMVEASDDLVVEIAHSLDMVGTLYLRVWLPFLHQPLMEEVAQQ